MSAKYLWKTDSPTSGLSYLERNLFNQILIDYIAEDDAYTSTDYIEILQKLRTYTLTLEGNSDDKIARATSEAKFPYAKGTTLTEALRHHKASCVSSPALTLGFYEMIDFDGFLRCKIGNIPGSKDGIGHFFIKKEIRRRGSHKCGSNTKYKNLESGDSYPGAGYEKRFGAVPSVEPRRYLEAFIVKIGGDRLSDLGKNDEALSCYDKALRIYPKLIPALSSKGVVLAQIGKYKEALECLNAALKIDSKDVSTLINKGSLLGMYLKDYNGALKCYDLALEVEPTNKLLLENRRTLITMTA